MAFIRPIPRRVIPEGKGASDFLSAKPAPSAGIARNRQVMLKEAAIKRRLAQANTKAKTDATKQAAKKGSASYKSQYIRGANEGFMKSDYGVDPGAAIPYQIGSKTEKVTKSKPKPKPKPKPKTGGVSATKPPMSNVPKKYDGFGRR